MAIFARSGHIYLNPPFPGGTVRATGTGTITLDFQPKALMAWVMLRGSELSNTNADSSGQVGSAVFVRETTGAPEAISIATNATRQSVSGGFYFRSRNDTYANDGLATQYVNGLRDLVFNVTAFTTTGFTYSYDIDYRVPMSVVWVAFGGPDLRAAMRTVTVPFGVAANGTFDVDTLDFRPTAFLSLPAFNDDHYTTGFGWATANFSGGVFSTRHVTTTAALQDGVNDNSYSMSHFGTSVRWLEFVLGAGDTASERIAAEITPSAFLSNGVRFTVNSPRLSLTQPQLTMLLLGGARLRISGTFESNKAAGTTTYSWGTVSQQRALFAIGHTNTAASGRGRTTFGFLTPAGPSWSQASYWHSLVVPHNVDPNSDSTNSQVRVAKNSGALVGIPDYGGISPATIKTVGYDVGTSTVTWPSLSGESLAIMVIGEPPDELNIGGASAIAGSTVAGSLSSPQLLVTPAAPVLADAATTASATSLRLAAALGTPADPRIVAAETVVTGAFGRANPISGATVTMAATSLAQATGLIDARQLLATSTATAATTVQGTLTVRWLVATAAAPATVTATALAEAYTAYTFPTILPARPVDIPGTINLVRDPGYESGLGWAATGVALGETAAAWTGARSARAAFTASGQAVTVETITGIGTTAATAYVGSVRVRGASAAARLRLEATYGDGTTQQGAWTAAALGAEWTVAQAGALTTTAGKVLSRLTLRVEATAAGTLDIDGAQVEAGTVPSAWCSGALGDPAGTWLGVAHASPSWRQTVPMWTGAVPTPTGGRGGAIRVEARLYRATYDNRFIEDISDWVVDGRVTMDTNRDVTWSLDATILGDGWSRLTPYLDWVAPYLTVTFPDGSVSQGQLGLYLVMDSPVSRQEYGSVVQLTAMDPLWLLGAQTLPAPLVARNGSFKTDLVKSLLQGAVLTQSDTQGAANTSVRRYLIPTATLLNGYPAPFADITEWEAGTSRLRVINDVLLSAGCSPLYTTRTGVFTTRRFDLTLNDRLPVRTYAANAPAGWALDNRVDRGLFGDVVEAVDTTPYADGLENEVLLVNDSASSPLQVRYRITDTDNYRSFAAGSTGKNRRNTRRVAHRYLDHPELAAQVARAMAESLSLRNQAARMRVIPEPHLELAREVVGMAVFDANGDPVITGKWAVQRAVYGFTPGDAWMELEVARVYGITGVAEVYQ